MAEDLIGRQGRRLTEALLEAGSPETDPTIQMRINGSFILREEIPKQEIRQGDHVTFFKPLAGG